MSWKNRGRWIVDAVRTLACLAVLSGAATSVLAQQPPQYVQQAQNAYYGNYQDNRIPGYIYPRTMPMPANTGYSSNGITYYYVNNPNGPNYYPFTSPYGTPRAYQTQSRGPTYPMPPNTPPPQPRPTYVEDESGDGRKPVLTYHRDTNESCWVKADYLGAFIRPMPLGAGPLVTTGSSLNVSPGALGLPATRVLFGDPIDYSLQSGIRLQAGMFLDRDNVYSVELGGFYLLPRKQSFSVSGDANGNPVLSRPIFDVALGTERVFLASDPGNIAGGLVIENKSEMFGAELNARYHRYLRERLHINALLGFRYLHLAERLRIEEPVSNVLPGFVTFQGNRIGAGDSLFDQDNFGTANNFFGPQVGAQIAWEHRAFTLDAFAKLAIGPSLQQTTINGSTTLISPNGNQTANGGILALPSNSGTHNRTVLGIVPEFGFNLGVELSQHCRLNLGYSFLMWSHVVRPGNQYDRGVNPGQVPGSPTFGNPAGPLSPTYRFNDEFFWTHFINIGLEIHY